MRIIAVLSLWLLGGLAATGAVTAAMQQTLVSNQQRATAEAYAPPALTSMGFIAEDPRKS